jgi:dihydroorotate dehydrogenase
MYSYFRPLLFKLEPEAAHRLTIQMIRLAGIFSPITWLLKKMYAVPEKPVDLFGLHFQNPVGLAAGYDKDGTAFRGLSTLGFGHIEIGTVTPHPQPGNPKPRLFRLVEDQGLINRMGFPGRGADFMAKHLTSPRPRGLILGVNLGKNKDTPLEDAARDYLALTRRFLPLADYLAINISSPNTVGLRKLQGSEMLNHLLKAVARERVNSLQHTAKKTPILVKLAPDLTSDELDSAIDVILDSGMDGVIAVNTTLGRGGLRSIHFQESGGLSGEPLRGRSEACLNWIVKKLDGRLPIVSVGGIMNPIDARHRLEAGASLVQIYTGLVYAGPGLVRQIVTVL